MQVINGDQRKLERTRYIAPEQKAVGDIERQARAGVRLNHRLRVVAEKERRIVQVSVSTRAHIRAVQSEAISAVAPSQLVFPIAITSRI